MRSSALTTPQPVASQPRIPYWDNARFVCVTLVVVGHAIQRLTYANDDALAVYLFIFSFHIPAFAIISGYFSRSEPPGRRQLTRIIAELVVPYVIFESIWSLVHWLATGSPGFNPTKPSWTLWFLLALAIFRVALPYLALLRWPLIIAVILSVSVGFFDNVDSTLSLARVFGTLPFFVLGWKCRGWGIGDRWLSVGKRAWGIRGIALIVLAVWVGFTVAFIGQWRRMDLTHWFFYDESYLGLGQPYWWSGLIRLGLIALAVLLSAAVFTLIPRHRVRITTLGTATMYVYLLHTFALFPIRESELLRGEHSPLVLAATVAAGVGLAVVLALPAVTRPFRSLVEPRIDWLLARPSSRP